MSLREDEMVTRPWTERELDEFMLIPVLISLEYFIPSSSCRTMLKVAYCCMLVATNRNCMLNAKAL